MVKSLKSEILERLDLRKGGRSVASNNIKKATKDFQTSSAPQFRGKSKEKRDQMAVAAGLGAARGESVVPQKGDKCIYEGKQVVVDSYNARSGLVVVKSGRQKEIMVRAVDLKTAKLNEAVIGLGRIAPTWVERPSMTKMLPQLTLADIGLYEDDFTGEKDEQEEDHDNGSNIRHDGHTGKKEVDELPTPSDTIAPAYSDEKPPKHMAAPLSTHVGAEEDKLWQEPNWDGYDYPADAPEIPDADFIGDEGGNARAPECGDGHDGGDGQEEARDDDEDSERTDETYVGFKKLEKKLSRKGGVRNPGAIAASIGRKKYGKKKFQSAAAHQHKMHEAFSFVTEADDLLGKDEDREPSSGDTITVTLPAMASILVTVARRMGADIQNGGEDEMLLKSMVEALDEIGQGIHSGCIDVDDLQAVAAHMNGEETQEIENRDEGRPDHEGMEGGERHPADKWPGDMEKSGTGKTKMMDGAVSEGSTDFYGIDDILAEMRMTEEEELRLIKKRAGLKYW